MSRRILVLGGSGQLGSEVVDKFDCIAPSHDQLNVCKTTEVYNYITELMPDIVINCTAYHNVGECEKHPKIAHAMNCVVVKSLVDACNKVEATLVHFSTDYVFDGRKGMPYYENDKVCPINEYGRSKVCGEQYMVDNCNDYIIGRVSSLYGKLGHSNKGPNFVEKVLGATEPMGVVADQIMSPTYCGDVVDGLETLLKSDQRGIIHMSNAGYCSWYEFAYKIKELSNLSIDIEPISIDSFDMPYSTPRNSALSTHSSFYMPYWVNGLTHYLYERGKLNE